MKSFIIALFCIATALADISELLYKPVAHHLEDHHHQQDAHPAEQHSEAIHVEKHITFDFDIENEGVEIVEAIEVLPVVSHDVAVKEVQLTDEHKDYQAPYSYDKPTVQLDYVAPIVPEPTEEVAVPIFKEQPISNNYLPPKYTEDRPAKRHVKYVVRRRV